MDNPRNSDYFRHQNLNAMSIGSLARRYHFFIILLCPGFPAAAQIVIPLETANNVLVLEVDKKQDLHNLYLGRKLKDTGDYRHLIRNYPAADDYTALFDAAYAPAGGRGLIEPAVSITHADGNPSSDLRYISHHIDHQSADITLLAIRLKDPVYDVEVTVYYKSYYKQDVIEQWSAIRHHEKGNIILQKFASANLHLNASGYWLKQYHGDWVKEMQPEESRLTYGIKTLDSKLGTRADLFQPPVFMVSLDRPATEDEGKVLLGGLEWSGNFRTDLEIDPLNGLRIISGVNNYASAYTLSPGEEFTGPAFVYTYSDQGKGDASRKIQRWARDYKLLDGKGPRLTLLNNWESTYFDFNEHLLGELLKDTRKLGDDFFLLDDGWFGNRYPRNDDHAALGDWQENKQKLPNGITSLVRDAQNGIE